VKTAAGTTVVRALRAATSAAVLDPTATPDDPRADRRTRDAVITQLMAAGPLTATALGERLGLTAAGVRRHLDALLDEGAVVTREPISRGPRGRGRPPREYLLTSSGRARMPHAYDQLAVQALEYLAETGGDSAVTGFARRRAQAVVAPYRDRLDAAPDVATKTEVLAEALTAAGFSASVEQVGVGAQLCQHHCPVGHVATRFPQLCEEEMAVFTEALGTYGQRLATIAHGDAACTTFVPAAAVAASAAAVGERRPRVGPAPVVPLPSNDGRTTP
jgi:predicted ArsR family transcriptional regulator